jgi:nitrogen fixation protein FixH
MGVVEGEQMETVRRLRQAVAIEVVFAVLALATTALLVNAAPARAESSAPFIETLQTDEVWFDVEVRPAAAGPNEVHVTATEPGGLGRDVLEMTATLSEPSRDIAKIDIPLRRLAPGHYVARGVSIPFAGDWELEVRALLTEVDEAVATATVPVR